MPPLDLDNTHTLKALAVASATVASYAAFSLAGRGVRATRQSRRAAWLAAASLIMGIGIWSMHYVSALGEPSNAAMHYVVRVLVILAIAIGSSAAAFWMLVPAPGDRRRQMLSGGLLGLGVTLVALLGTQGRYVGGLYTAHLWRLAGCALLGVGTAQVATGLSFGRARSYRYEEWLRAGAALVLGIGLACAHLIAVIGTPAAPSVSAMRPDAWVVGAGTLGEVALTTTIVLVLAVTMATSGLDQRRYRELMELNSRLADSQKALLESQGKLREANAMLGELSIRDGLTGLYNRRHFDTALDTEWRRSVRTLRPLALLMLDVDCFKALNDTYGHARGDECLRETARVLEEMPRRGHDVVARYGGEEFAVLLPGADSSGAMRIAEYIRASVEALQMEHCRSTVAKVVTISIGVSCRVPQIQEGPGAMMHEADMALYLAKQMGRNRVELRENLHSMA